VKSSPVVVGDRVLVGSYDQNLYAFEVKTGKVLWKFETSGPVHATPAVSNGIAYIAGCDEHFRAIRISDGKEMFQVSSGAYTGASPVLAGNMAYFGTFGNEVFAVDMNAKKIAWRYEHPVRKFPFYSSATLVNGKVILGGRDKMVHGIDAKTGKGLWTFTTRSRVESSPAAAGSRVFIGSNDGRFYVLDANSGKKLWEYEAGSAISSSPAISNGKVIVASQDGRVLCFGG
jgi:outer membrane protein assembly factor BamB